MKKVILFLLILISLGADAQRDTTSIPDTVPLITVKQLNEFDAQMKKVFTIEQAQSYQFLFYQLQKMYSDAAIEYKKKNKKP